WSAERSSSVNRPSFSSSIGDERVVELFQLPYGYDPFLVDVDHVCLLPDTDPGRRWYSVRFTAAAMPAELFTVRYKVWRSHKDKILHLLCGEGSEAFNTLPAAIRHLGPWTGGAPAKSNVPGMAENYSMLAVCCIDAFLLDTSRVMTREWRRLDATRYVHCATV